MSELNSDALKAAVEAHMAEFNSAPDKPKNEEEAAAVMLRAQAKAITAYLAALPKQEAVSDSYKFTAGQDSPHIVHSMRDGSNIEQVSSPPTNRPPPEPPPEDTNPATDIRGGRTPREQPTIPQERTKKT
jgi:hypothetical protein